MEYWIFYDLATGEDRFRGSGPSGSAILQEIPEGMGMVLVPAIAMIGPSVDLAIIRGALAIRIDAEAEQVRQRYLTPGAGQAMTYQRKEAEARAWTTDNSVATPFLSAEAPARGLTIAELAAEVILLADAWTRIGSAIEGMRMGAKAGIAMAANLGAVVAAARVDWTLLDA